MYGLYNNSASILVKSNTWSTLMQDAGNGGDGCRANGNSLNYPHNFSVHLKQLQKLSLLKKELRALATNDNIQILFGF